MGRCYQALYLPEFAPPAWVFLTVWPVLYLLMGTAAFLVQTAPGADAAARSAALRRYALYLLLNNLWPFLFFGAAAYWCALAELAAGAAVLLSALRRFAKIRPAAGWLLLPCLLWTLFAFWLSIVLLQLN